MYRHHLLSRILQDRDYGLIQSACGALMLLGLSALPAQAQQEATATVWRMGDTVHYDGYMDADAIQHVRFHAGRGAHVLSISSRGGDVELGMALGDVLAQHGMDVEVRDVCLSSCANYVFPAGKRKLLQRHSLLGWHGGVLQDMGDSIPPEARQQYQNYVQRVAPLERAFFQRIGVDQASTTWGQRPEFARYRDCIGWSYSLDMMRRFGIEQVRVQGGKRWQPPASFRGRCVFHIDAPRLAK